MSEKEILELARIYCSDRGLHPQYDSRYSSALHGFIAGYKKALEDKVE